MFYYFLVSNPLNICQCFLRYSFCRGSQELTRPSDKLNYQSYNKEGQIYLSASQILRRRLESSSVVFRGRVRIRKRKGETFIV